MGIPIFNGELILTKVCTAEEFEKYYELRWKKLRAPWNQPKGSELDEFENSSIHLMICDKNRNPVAIGRAHFNSDEEAQIRFMAVDDNWQKKGLGSIILQELEKAIKQAGRKYIVLNSRDSAIGFYEKHGFRLIKKTKLLFGSIPHHIMRKDL